MMPATRTDDEVTLSEAREVAAGDPGPYSIGSDHWPGLAKAAEECGELVQVVGKIIAAGGADSHWDGSDLRARLQDEIGDVFGALYFLIDNNGLSNQVIGARADWKQALFQGWHAEGTDASLNRDPA